MAVGKTIRTYFNGQWHDGDVPIMSAADHAAWLGSSVFDGARWLTASLRPRQTCAAPTPLPRR